MSHDAVTSVPLLVVGGRMRWRRSALSQCAFILYTPTFTPNPISSETPITPAGK